MFLPHPMERFMYQPSLDQKFMLMALAEGEKGRLTSAPNPWVGCILVKKGKVIAAAHHQKAGSPHAEVLALEKAQGSAHGSTAYVTLEPCSHHGKTPPCVEALIRAKVSRVVVALQDPDPKVSGQGLMLLQKAGIDLSLGIEKKAAETSLKTYLHQRKKGRPYCIVKSAMSLDGKIAAQDKSSQWITEKPARKDVHLLRRSCQAILIGSETALQDKPSLTVRHVPLEPANAPLRVLLDSHGRVPVEGPLFDTSLAPTLVFTSEQTSVEKQKEWKQAGASVATAPLKQKGLCLQSILQDLGQRGVLSALIEGGAFLHSSFLEQGFADQMTLYMGGCLLGNKGSPLFHCESPPSIALAQRWNLVGVKQLGADLCATYEPKG